MNNRHQMKRIPQIVAAIDMFCRVLLLRSRVCFQLPAILKRRQR